MTKALVSPLLYWRSLSKKYPLHHNHTHSKKFCSEFRKLHVRDYSIVLKSNKNRVPCYLRVAFLASELHLYLHILIYMFYPCICIFWRQPSGASVSKLNPDQKLPYKSYQKQNKNSPILQSNIPLHPCINRSRKSQSWHRGINVLILLIK